MHESKICDLSNFKNQKLNEEREEKVKKKKEAKKSKQKGKIERSETTPQIWLSKEMRLRRLLTFQNMKL